ncbi:DUF6221 family protein [Streptomyces turgidiscabies]|uniref:DUF6221 family protein n=1 Tax=Streptomyces turgidiscabies TaxID=85558 RepID=UPI0038F77F43
MDDLAGWLGEQLDIDERIARSAADYDDGAAHDVEGPPGTWACLDEAQWFGPSYRGGVIAPRIGQVNAPELGAHIAAHDPARVLRDIDRDRRTLVRCQEAMFAASPMLVHFAKQTLREMALSFSDRPGYAEAVASAE